MVALWWGSSFERAVVTDLQLQQQDNYSRDDLIGSVSRARGIGRTAKCLLDLLELCLN